MDQQDEPAVSDVLFFLPGPQLEKVKNDAHRQCIDPFIDSERNHDHNINACD